jgi:hypothetical protein
VRLVPNNKISGGRIISHCTPSGKSYIAIALRQAANSIGNQANHDRAAGAVESFLQTHCL